MSTAAGRCIDAHGTDGCDSAHVFEGCQQEVVCQGNGTRANFQTEEAVAGAGAGKCNLQTEIFRQSNTQMW